MTDLIYLLWAIVNIAFLFTFFGMRFNATKLVRQRYGMLLTVVFIFGLLSFVINTGVQSSQQKTWELNPADSIKRLVSGEKQINLQENLFSDCRLFIDFGRSNTGDYIPIHAFSSVSGLSAGTKWVPLRIQVKPSADKKHFEYIVNGVVEWKLFWATIYTERKRFEGVVRVMSYEL